jgi:spermidine synthase
MVYVLVFLSGLAGLVYEVLWMKQLGLLFGNTSHAAAATLAAFFAGLAAGSWFWGRRSSRMKNPLRIYVWLEVGIAFTALLYFGILDIYYRIYPALYQGVDSTVLLLAVKFALAVLLVFPPAFFMGGTIPVMGQHVIRNLSTFGATSALLYGVNTLGAAIGACLAGFCLPLWLGFKATCLVAMVVTGSIAFTAFRLSRNTVMDLQEDGQMQATGVIADRGTRWPLLLVGFVSGFGVLALEVLWTRMFAQVLENSVYTFAAILVVVLLCLALGAFSSSRLARLSVAPRTMLALLMLVGGIAVSITPFVFMQLTDSLQILVSRGTWLEYLGLIFRNVVFTIALPALALGSLFPLLMKAEEKHAGSAGRSLGVLAAVNTAGAILGSVSCGFVFLEILGMWGTMQALAVLYLVAALAFPVGWRWKSIALKAACLAALILQFTGLNPRGLPINSVDKLRPREEILETWEGSDCTVAVARNSYGLSIKINSHYGLGSTGAFMQQKIQSDLPLMIFPDTKSIFFLGLGTGITAGSALDSQFSNVTRVVACELVPEVITASKKYMTQVEGQDFTGGLFNDPRATVLAEDGRHYLMATHSTFDMINSDLFVPFRSGAGSLYSKEHFESVKERLAPGGVFFQWLPLYQVTEVELFVIIRTMLDVFGQVSLWRNNFQPGEEVIAIAGHKDATPLPACTLDTRADKLAAVEGKTYRDMARLSLPFNSQTTLFFYCGNLTGAKELFAGYPINTDDKPIIEYMAPRNYRNRKDTATPWFVGPRLARLVDEVQKRCPPATDPLLAKRSPEDRRLLVAGTAFHWTRIWGVIGDEKECQQAWQRFVKEWTASE